MKNHLKSWVVALAKWRVIAFWLLVLVLFGTTLLKIQTISNPKPDQAFLASQRTEQATKINIPDALRVELENSTNTRVKVSPSHGQHGDPFNP